MAARSPTVRLDQVQRRLEVLLTAMYGRPIAIAAVERHTPHWAVRLGRALRRDSRASEPTPAIGAGAIHLPAALDAGEGMSAAVARFRLLAVELAERLTRGSAALAPADDPLERDLYMLREGAAVDARIARALPGMQDVLADERRAALADRPRLERLTESEREVELMFRAALESSPHETATVSSDPAASLAWAKETAARIRRERGWYRGLPPAKLWGTFVHFPVVLEAENDKDAAQMPPAKSSDGFETRSFDAQAGIAEDQSIPSREQAAAPNAPAGGRTPDEPDASDEMETASARSADATTSRSRDGTSQGAPPEAQEPHERHGDLPPGVTYDEWDSFAGRYLPHAATVREYEPPDADGAWALETLNRHAALVRQIRHQFERLRARRALLGRQRAGDELDIDAAVKAIVDRRIGQPPSDRLYRDARPARRGLAISLLVDVSGSTDAGVTDDLRIIDLEKVALLLAGEALDALGDLYAIHAFSGQGASVVKITTVKAFSESSGHLTRRRISALESGGFTRLGAAVRHATRQLARQTAGHRLLLILSDGRPNDLDRYQGDYAVEDTRRAIMEARASGVYPFCLTVDRDASEYLPRIFGAAGHTILQRPQQLPTALVRAVGTLIKRPS